MGEWKPTAIRWVNRTLDSSTGATHVETDHGQAFAKFMGNPEGEQALYCELLGTRAAAWLGLRTFDIGIVDAPFAGLATYRDGSSSQVGPAFVSRFEDGTAWGGSSEELHAVENPEAIAGFIVLDTWLLNCDRYRPEGNQIRCNTRNVFLSAENAGKGKFNITAMDHTHCFTCGRPLAKAIAGIDRVKDERLYGHFPAFKGYLSHDRVRVFTKRLKAFSKEQAQALIQGIPPLWAPGADVQAAVAEFLAQRASFVGDNIRKMLIEQGYLEPELDLGG
jgi:hypothetical protein